MDFPAGGTIDEAGYALKDEEYEGIYIGVDNDEELVSAINLNYYFSDTYGDEAIRLKQLRKRLNLDLEFNEIENEDRIIYYSPFEYDEFMYGVAAYLQNKVRNGGIQVIYTTECTSSKTECEESKDSEKKE